MEIVGAFEAKTHLSELLQRVEKGSEFTITRHGKPVARLVPAVDPQTDTGARQAWLLAESRRLRKKNTLGGLKIRDLVNEGRKY
jgi:prevent-host-death family protein